MLPLLVLIKNYICCPIDTPIMFRNTLLFILSLCCLAGISCHKNSHKSDLIIRGGTIITMDPQRNVIENGMIVIDKGVIIALGSQADLEQKFKGKQVLDATGQLVIPGLINTHTHVPMTLFRGMADDLNLETWLQEHIFPAEAKHVNEAFVRAGTKLAIAEMIRGGTTTFCDMYYYEDAIAEECAQAGIRAVLAQSIIDFPAPGFQNTDQAFALTRSFLQKWKTHPLITPAIGPHAPYTVSTEHLKKSRLLSDETGAPVVIHVSETASEVTTIQEQYGLRPVEYLQNILFLNERTILAHAVHVSDAEIDMIAHAGCGVAHNPESNMKLASGTAPVPRMLAKSIPVGLGTDGAASNNDLSLWDEMDMAAKLHKLVSGNPEALSATTAFEMATIGGAKALHLSEKIGSLEIGKQADIVLVSIDGLHQQPMYNVYSGLVYTTKASDVRSVVIAGKVVMRERELLTLNEAEIINTANRFKEQIKQP